MRRIHQVLVSHMIGGAGVVAIRLAASLVKRGMDCQGWVTGRGPASEALTRDQVPWRLYNLAAMQQGTLPHLAACARMAVGLSGRRPPIVHVHNPTVYRLLRPALSAVGARTVVHFQIEPTREEIEYALRSPPDHVVACARYIAEAIRRTMGDSPVAISAAPNAIDIEKYHPAVDARARERVGLSTSRFVLLMMANLAPHKGQATVLRATRVLHARGVPVECWLAGEDRGADGAYERELRGLAEELGIAAIVRFLGFRADGPELLRAADVFLLPSTHEGLPLSLLEAQAAGLPVIGSTIPGIREVVVDGETGFLVAADDFRACADRVQTLYDQPDRRRQITDAASRVVKREYAWSVFEDRMLGIYESLR